MVPANMEVTEATTHDWNGTVDETNDVTVTMDRRVRQDAFECLIIHINDLSLHVRLSSFGACIDVQNLGLTFTCRKLDADPDQSNGHGQDQHDESSLFGPGTLVSFLRRIEFKFFQKWGWTHHFRCYFGEQLS